MHQTEPAFRVKLADSDDELRAAQALRYRVFVTELGGTGPMVDHRAELEQDRFDPYFDHLLLIDDNRGGNVVGVYRLLTGDMAEKVGQFYSEDEYELDLLRSSGRKLMELGRSCVDPAYRGGTAMYHLWNGLARYVADHQIEILFGVASFHGTNPQELAQPLSLLHHRHLAPEELRVKSKPKHYQSLDLIPPDQLDRRAAMLQVPSLIKAYLRLGGYVGDGAYIDHDFNTTDVCLIVDALHLEKNNKYIYSKGVKA